MGGWLVRLGDISVLIYMDMEEVGEREKQLSQLSILSQVT